MVLGTTSVVSIVATFANARAQYFFISEDKVAAYKDSTLTTKVAGFAAETALCFSAHYLIFSIDLAGRVALIRKIPPFLLLLIQIIQPMAQLNLSQKTTRWLVKAFRARFITCQQ